AVVEPQGDEPSRVDGGVLVDAAVVHGRPLAAAVLTQRLDASARGEDVAAQVVDGDPARLEDRGRAARRGEHDGAVDVDGGRAVRAGVAVLDDRLDGVPVGAGDGRPEADHRLAGAEPGLAAGQRLLGE